MVWVVFIRYDILASPEPLTGILCSNTQLAVERRWIKFWSSFEFISGITDAGTSCIHFANVLIQFWSTVLAGYGKVSNQKTYKKCCLDALMMKVYRGYFTCTCYVSVLIMLALTV